jgi:hypothetical protein
MKRMPSRRAAEDAPYEIGYRKPPKHTRFRPGQSGHPSGRPAVSSILGPRSERRSKKKSPSGREIGHAPSPKWTRSYK